MLPIPMTRRKRIRSLRQKAWWISSHTLFQCIAALIVVGILASEHVAKNMPPQRQEQLHLSAPHALKEKAETSIGMDVALDPRDEESRMLTRSKEEVHVEGTSLQANSSSTISDIGKFNQPLTNGVTKESNLSLPVIKQPLDGNKSTAASLSIAKQADTDGLHRNSTNVTPNPKLSTNSIKSSEQKEASTPSNGLIEIKAVHGTNIPVSAIPLQPVNTEARQPTTSSHSSETEAYTPGNSDAFRKEAEKKAIEDAIARRTASVDLKNLHSAEEGTKRYPASSTPQGNVTARPDQAKVEPGKSFTGVALTNGNADLFKMDNITFLSHMIYKIVKTHKLQSIVDIPCTKSIYWMPEVLQRLEFEVPNFRYRCIVPDDDTLVDAVLRYKDISSAVVLKDTTFWASKVPKSDIAFLWYGIGFMAPKESWQLMKAITMSGTQYIALPHYPTLKNNAATATPHGRVNIRRAPYLFDEAWRLIRDVGTVPGWPKQLLLYKTGRIRGGVL